MIMKMIIIKKKKKNEEVWSSSPEKSNNWGIMDEKVGNWRTSLHCTALCICSLNSKFNFSPEKGVGVPLTPGIHLGQATQLWVYFALVRPV